MKKLRIFYSMKTGVVLLILIGILSIIGTLIPQQMPLHWYEHRYNSQAFALIKFFQLHDMYHSLWFSLLFTALTLNLFLCSIIRLPQIYKKSNTPYFIGKNNLKTSLELGVIREKLWVLGFKKFKADGNLLYSTKGKIGFLGSWITHVAVLSLVLFYFLGKIYGFSYQISGLPGETIEVFNTDLQVYIEDFLVDFRDDFSVNQYYSYIKILNAEEEFSGTVSVNNPLDYKNYRLYQVATGWATKMSITFGGEPKVVRPMYQQDFHFIDDNSIVRVLDIRPDVVNNSPLAENPIIIYQLIYKNKIESMNFIEPNKPIRWRGNTIVFSQPERYTVLEIASDPTLPGVWFASLLLILGLFLSFYVNPRSVVIRPLRDGDYLIYIYSQKDEEQLIDKLIDLVKGDENYVRKSVV